MKNHKTTPASKLITRYDKELKTILVNDLNNVKNIKHQLLNGNQGRLQIR